MASINKNNEKSNSDSKFEDENFIQKAKVIADQIGISIEEVKERKISKNQLKKMLKAKKFKTYIGIKRKQQREKEKLKRKEQIKNNEYQAPVFTSMDKSPNKVKVVIDLSFDNKMSDRELQKTLKQVGCCYSINRRSKEPVQFYLSSVNGKIKEEIDKRKLQINNWDINIITEHWYDYFKSTNELSKIIFLSSDSDQTLPDQETMTSKRNEFIFIIGGLVDHNFHKNLTLKLANEKNIKTAKLPIDDHLKMAMSKVLAINQVFEIILNVTTGTSWPDSLAKSVPLRKRIVEDQIDKTIPKSTEQNQNEQCQNQNKQSNQ